MSYSPQVTEPVLPEKAEKGSYIDWAAIIGGIIFSSAISIVLLSFGSALGLSFIDVSTKNHAVAAGLAAAIWFIWVEVSSFMAGAYLTGRLRRSVAISTEHETEVRDGSHGLLVWAGCVVVGTILAFSGTASTLNSVGNAVKTATEAASTAAQGAAPAAMQYYSDTLLRPTPQANPAVQTARGTTSSEVGSILAHSALTAPTDEDKTYLAQLVSSQTGASPEDAKARVEKTYADIQKAKSDAAAVAESARRLGVIAAFLLAASLLLSGAAAFWAATYGGHHKDKSVVFTGFLRRV